jgi:hypothetical protein
LQFFGAASDCCRAGDQAHALRHLQLIHHFAQFGALAALDAARDAAAARVVRHQDQVAAGEADKGRQRGALVAALVLVDLDDQFLAFAQGFLDRRTTRVYAGLEKGAGDFLEGQKAVPFRSVIDKRRFQAGFHAGNDRFINVALFLLLVGRFNVQVNELLTIDNGNAEFLGLCCVKEHAFHRFGLPRAFTGAEPCSGSNRSVVGGTPERLSGKATNRGISPTRLLVGP